VNATGWSRRLEVPGGGTGVVSHAGLVLLRHLADKTGLTSGLSRGLASPRILVHDRGRLLADLACSIADGARVLSDFRVMGDQRELFGLVASVPTAWRTLQEIARGGRGAETRVTAAVSTARRHAWAPVTARHGTLPGVRLADKVMEGVTCIRLDATVVPAHSEKELAEANFKGFGHHPLLASCDNTGGEPLAWVLRRGSAGSNTAADHIALADTAIAALPPVFRRRLMITTDGAGASHALIAHLDKLAARRGYQLAYSAGWALTVRDKAALRLVPEQAWQAAIDPRGKVRERRADDACGNSQCAHRPCRLRGARSTSGHASRVASPLLPFPWPTRPGGSPGPGLPPRVDHRYATP
jgi:hypothetical protein